MTRKITIPGIITIFILFLAFSVLPNENTTDTKSSIKNAEESYKTDVVIDTSKQVIENVGNQALETSCKNGSSQACQNTNFGLAIISIVFVILIIGLLVVGIIGVAKWVINLIEQYT